MCEEYNYGKYEEIFLEIFRVFGDILNDFWWRVENYFQQQPQGGGWGGGGVLQNSCSTTVLKTIEKYLRRSSTFN